MSVRLRLQYPLSRLSTGVCCTTSMLLLACGATTGTDVDASSGADLDPLGFPVDVLVRPDLQLLVDAGLDRRTGPLLDALDDPDPAVRATAAQALASVQGSVARPRLAALLADTEPAVRRNAAFALGLVPDGGDAAELINALDSEADPLVRFTLLEAAGRIGSATDLERILALGSDARVDDDPGMSLALYHFARRGVADPRAASTLLALMNADDEPTRIRAALALAALRDRSSWGVAPDDLRSVLDAMPVDRREAAPLLRVLAGLGDAADLPRLHSWLADGAHWTVRTAAAASFGAHAAAAASGATFDALLTALDDSSHHVAGVAAESIVELIGRAPSADTGAGLDPGLLAAWIRAHPERPAVAAALLPGLAGTPHEALVIDWATGRLAPARPRAMAWPALVRIASPAADSMLVAGLDGSRRDAYVAAALLAQRLADLPEDAALRSSLVPLVTRRLAAWGPHAPASDVRGAVRLVQALTVSARVQARELIDTAARHPHPEIRAAVSPPADPAAPVASRPRRSVDWSLLRAAGPRPCLAFTTARGAFTVALYPEAAPLAVSALLAWAAAGTFDDLTFHRVEPDFILQSGDFDNTLGYGGPGRGLRSEISQLRFAPGVLGIASSGKDTEGSQFFITHNYSPSLDGRYSAVGRIIAGHNVADDVALADPLLAVSPLDRSQCTTLTQETA